MRRTDVLRDGKQNSLTFESRSVDGVWENRVVKVDGNVRQVFDSADGTLSTVGEQNARQAVSELTWVSIHPDHAADYPDVTQIPIG